MSGRHWRRARVEKPDLVIGSSENLHLVGEGRKVETARSWQSCFSFSRMQWLRGGGTKADHLGSHRSLKDALTDLGSGPCHTAVDLAAKRDKIDGLGQKRLGTAFHGFSPGIRVAIGRDHDDGDVRSCCLGLRQ